MLAANEHRDVTHQNVARLFDAVRRATIALINPLMFDLSGLTSENLRGH